MSANDLERHAGDGWPVVAFADQASFESWLQANHRTQPGLWLKFAKKGSGIPSITLAEALEVVLCFGWIDSKLDPIDDEHYLLRYQPRRPRANWSARNKTLVERLIAEGRMRPAGLAAVEAAKADGRWEAN